MRNSAGRKARNPADTVVPTSAIFFWLGEHIYKPSYLYHSHHALACYLLHLSCRHTSNMPNLLRSRRGLGSYFPYPHHLGIFALQTFISRPPDLRYHHRFKNSIHKSSLFNPILLYGLRICLSKHTAGVALALCITTPLTPSLSSGLVPTPAALYPTVDDGYTIYLAGYRPEMVALCTSTLSQCTQVELIGPLDVFPSTSIHDIQIHIRSLFPAHPHNFRLHFEGFPSFLLPPDISLSRAGIGPMSTVIAYFSMMGGSDVDSAGTWHLSLS